MGCNGYPNDYGACPCNECLVKTMCHEECDAYRRYVNKIIRLTDEGLSDEEITKGMMKEYEENTNNDTV